MQTASQPGQQISLEMYRDFAPVYHSQPVWRRRVQYEYMAEPKWHSSSKFIRLEIIVLHLTKRRVNRDLKFCTIRWKWRKGKDNYGAFLNDLLLGGHFFRFAVDCEGRMNFRCFSATVLYDCFLWQKYRYG